MILGRDVRSLDDLPEEKWDNWKRATQLHETM